MRRPWQVWLLYFAGLAVVIPAMCWLTWQVMFLDQAEALTRRQAEREELIGRALWRMDSLVTPILAREAARPESYFQTVIINNAAEKDTEPLPASAPAISQSGPQSESSLLSAATLSPLITDPPQYVLLHFNWLPDDHIVSPQCPPESQHAFVCSQGIAEQDLNLFENRRQQLELSTTNQRLLAMLPTQSWSTTRWDYLSAVNGTATTSVPDEPPQVVMSAFPVSQLEEENASPADDLYAPQTNLYRQPTATPDSQADTAQVTTAPQAGRTSDPYLSLPATPATPSRSGRKFVPNDYEQRNSAYQKFAQQSVESSKRLTPGWYNGNETQSSATIYREGAFRPVWVSGKLLFARRVQKGDQMLVQGCWLDWNRIEQQLRREVSDILPQFLLVPVFDPQKATLNRVLATLPVQVEVPPLQPQSIQWSPVRLALVAAWIGLVLAALAAAVTLQGMILLAERRASFVSAVTHELRTPLTTFRMYAEMLAEGMIPEPERQQHYLRTLKNESDRLSHLVDNVLQYARLERGRPGKQRQRVSLAGLLERMSPRLAERAQQVGLQLQLEGDPRIKALELSTDPSAIEQILFNLVDNAAKYAAESTDKRLYLSWKLEHRTLALRLVDHGPGIKLQGENRLFIPFSKSANEAAESAPGVGLGLALSRRLARALGGELTWEQTPGGGATFCLRLPRNG